MTGLSSRLFAKNFVLFLALPIVLTLVVSTVSILIHRWNTEYALTSSTETIRQVGSTTELLFGELDSLNLTFSTNFEISSRLKRILRTPELGFEDFSAIDTIQSFINAPTNARPHIHSIYVYLQNPQRRLLTTLEGLTTVTDFVDSAWYASYLSNDNTRLVWSERRDLREFRFTSEPREILTLYRSIYAPGSARPEGVIVLNVYLSALEEMLAELKRWPEQVLMIIDDDGNLIASSGHLESELVERIVENPEETTGPIEVAFDRAEYVVAASSSTKFGWRYISATPSESLFQLADRIGAISIAMIALTLAVGIIYTFSLTRRTTSTIEQLQNLILAVDEESSQDGTDLRGSDHLMIMMQIFRAFVHDRYRKVRASESRLRERIVELVALQSQMNPHFLFNTLETINWKVVDIAGERTEANEMIEHLSRIMKYSLERTDSLTTLHDEIIQVQSYLAIQQHRYRSRFSVAWDLDQTLSQTTVIRLLLQPLVENAIYHGIKPIDRHCTLRISTQHEDHALLIGVEDDGAGMDGATLDQTRRLLTEEPPDPTHVGLQNTQRRIQIAFGADFGLHIESTLDAGTRVTVRLPLQHRT